MSTIAFDTETHCFGPGNKAPRIVCVQWMSDAPGDTPHLRHRDHPDTRGLIARWLTGHDLLVGHNVAYDTAVIAAYWPEFLPLIFAKYDRDEIADTMLREKLLQIAKGEYRSAFYNGEAHTIQYSLDACARRHLGLQLEKDIWRMRYDEFDAIVDTEQWPAGAREYALLDASTTLGVYRAQEALRGQWALGGDVLADQFRRARAAFALHLSSCWGMHTDPDAVDLVEKGLVDEMTELQTELQSAGIIRPDGTADTKAAMAVMEAECAAAGIPVGRTPKGAVSLSKASCERLDDEFSVMAKYSEFLHVRKTLANDVKMLRTGDEFPIHPSYDLADTGRTTCSGPNIQAINRGFGIRECFVPREGCCFIAADFSALELHTRAVWCLERIGYSKLADRLNAGKDVHCEMGAAMAHCTYEEMVAGIKAKDKKYKDFRQGAKAINFGYPGGLGAAKFRLYSKATYGVTFTEEEAYRFKQLWLSIDTEMVEFFRIASDLCSGRDAGTEESLFTGRWSTSRYTSLCNRRFQGLGADAALEALWRVTKACYIGHASALYGWRPVAFVHDEIICEGPGDPTTPLHELETLMCEGANSYLHRVPTHTEGVAMSRWSKGAKLLTSGDRVLVWSPEEKTK